MYAGKFTNALKWICIHKTKKTCIQFSCFSLQHTTNQIAYYNIEIVFLLVVTTTVPPGKKNCVLKNWPPTSTPLQLNYHHHRLPACITYIASSKFRSCYASKLACYFASTTYILHCWNCYRPQKSQKLLKL